jgi:hypothetical protein
MKLTSFLPKEINPRKKYIKFAVITLAIFIISGYLFIESLPDILRDKVEKKISEKVESNYKNFGITIGVIHDSSLPTLKMHIKKENWDKIAENRNIAMTNWVPSIMSPVMEKGSEDWVNCNIEINNGEKIGAKTRLKGRLGDHWASHDYWSFNIKLNGDTTFQGMKSFSIQHPRTRGYATEWLFHQILRKNNLISLRYDFCYVSINGATEKIYAYEEGLDKRLIENNQLREGIILKINSDYGWFYGTLTQIKFSNSDISVYDQKKVSESEPLKKLQDLAIERIDAFRNKKNTTSQTFDSVKWSKFFALLDWLGHDHAGHYDNARFYVNPITTLIEPIGRDYSAIIRRDTKPLLGEYLNTAQVFTESWFECLFQDKQFYKDYLFHLDQISKFDFNSDDFALIRSGLAEKFEILNDHDPLAAPSPETIASDLEFNRKIIYDKLNQNRKRVFAYIMESEKGLELSVNNTDTFPMVLEEISLDNKTLFKWKEEIWLEGHHPYQAPRFYQIPLNKISKEILLQKKVLLHIKYPGTNLVFKEPLLLHPSGSPAIAVDPLPLISNIAEFSFLKTDEEKKEVLILSGNQVITKPLILPPGYRVKNELPLSIDIKNQAFIYSKSPISWLGIENSPIKIFSSDQSGGIIILNATQESQMEYVIFQDLKAIETNGLNVTGSITIYESPISINNCSFLQNHSEDSLNIVRCKFILKQCVFENSFSDAFDGDFIVGSIEDCFFKNSGNDGIDISGSVVKVKNLKIIDAGDKGISVGEKSKLTGENIYLENCEIGIACKDSSHTQLENVKISKSHLGLTVYQKKSEYSGGKLSINNFEIIDTKVPYLRENLSEILINNNLIPVADDKVKELLYGKEFGKKSE